mgnify:CR=1 FL=1
MTNITETEALNKVAAYCSTAEHCRAEISEKLQRWGLPYDVIDRILKRLVDEKYIDEKGALDISKCDLIAYANGGYYPLGKKIGKFGFSVQKRKSRKRKKTTKKL